MNKLNSQAYKQTKECENMIEGLRQWAFALVLTAMIGSLAVAISNSQNLKKYIKFTCALIALAVMIAPISSLFRGLPDIFNFNQATQTVYNPELDFNLQRIIIEKSEEMLGRRISALVEQKTGIKPEFIYIYSNINNNTGADVQVDIEKIIINMPERAVSSADFGEIQEYLKEILECEIIIE